MTERATSRVVPALPGARRPGERRTEEGRVRRILCGRRSRGLAWLATEARCDTRLEESEGSAELVQRHGHGRLPGQDGLVVFAPRRREAQLLHAGRQDLLSGGEALVAESLRPRWRSEPLPRHALDGGRRSARRSAQEAVEIDLNLYRLGLPRCWAWPYAPLGPRRRFAIGSIDANSILSSS